MLYKIFVYSTLVVAWLRIAAYHVQGEIMMHSELLPRFPVPLADNDGIFTVTGVQLPSEDPGG